MDEYIYHFDHDDLMANGDDFQGDCGQQVANGTLKNLSALIALAVIFKILKHFPLPTYTSVFLHVLTTWAIILWTFRHCFLALIVFNLFSITSLLVAIKRWPGYLILTFNIILLIATQLISSWYKMDEFFLSVRGVLMMNIMRLTTVAFAIEEDTHALDRLVDFAGYIEYVYYPPLIIFGPYLTYRQFNMMRKKKWMRSEDELGQMVKFAAIIFVALTMAIVSSCQFEVYTPTSQFMEDALTALSFRLGHYFVCYVGYALILFLGSGVTVTDPLLVEFPRSVVDIVSEWNKPFHTFLHKYVFKARFFNSIGLSVFLTFTVSSLLHGLDFQMSITLLALGFIAYSETVFRKRLAARFSMCVTAKPCQIRANRFICGHRHNNIYGRSTIINLFFGVLSMYHLVFTGMTFTDDYVGTGYPLDHALTIWGTHYYASLVISLVFLVLSKVI